MTHLEAAYEIIRCPRRVVFALILGGILAIGNLLKLGGHLVGRNGNIFDLLARLALLRSIFNIASHLNTPQRYYSSRPPPTYIHLLPSI